MTQGTYQHLEQQKSSRQAKMLSLQKQSCSKSNLLLQAPPAEAFACNATGQLSAVGSSAEMLALAGSETQLVNLQGSFVTPVSIS